MAAGVTQVSQNAEFDVAIGTCQLQRLARVMRDGKGVELQVANRSSGRCLWQCEPKPQSLAPTLRAANVWVA